MRIEDKYAQALRIAADLAAENAALWAALNCGDAAIRDLVDDLDDMQAEWAEAHQEYRLGLGRLDSRLFIALNANQGLLDRIAELEALDRQAVIRADAQAEEIARLEAENATLKDIERMQAAIIDESVAAMRSNATPFSVELERRIAEAVCALRNAAASAPLVDSALVLALANRLHSGPRAPSVPRRAENGVEVKA